MDDPDRSASPTLPPPITCGTYSSFFQSLLLQPTLSSSPSPLQLLLSPTNTTTKLSEAAENANSCCFDQSQYKPLLADQSQLTLTSLAYGTSKPFIPKSAKLPPVKLQQQKARLRDVLHVPSDDDSGCALDEVSTWFLPGMQSADQLHQPTPSRDDRIEEGEQKKKAMETMLRQLPPQDFDERFCRALSEEEKRELKLFNLKRKAENLGRGSLVIGKADENYRLNTDSGDLKTNVDEDKCGKAGGDLNSRNAVTCFKCGGDFSCVEFSVKAERASPERRWHLQCFVCCVCEEALVDLIYFYEQERLFCGRHHAESLKPRCSACDEIIFADECTEAESMSWHVGHFTCQSCHTQLGGRRYVMVGTTSYCCPCFDKLIPEILVCSFCGLGISHEEGHVTFDSHHWHANQACFKCIQCKRFLLDQQFYLFENTLFCCKCFELIPGNISRLNKIPQIHETSKQTGTTSFDACKSSLTVAARERLSSAAHSEDSLEDRLMNISGMSSTQSESDSNFRKVVSGVNHSTRSVSSASGFYFDDLKQKLLQTSFHSCNSNYSNNNNNYNYTATNDNGNCGEPNTGSNMNVYERLKSASLAGSDASSLRLYETVALNPEHRLTVTQMGLDLCWNDIIESGSKLMNVDFKDGGDIDKWLETCRFGILENVQNRNGRAAGFTSEILNHKQLPPLPKVDVKDGTFPVVRTPSTSGGDYSRISEPNIATSIASPFIEIPNFKNTETNIINAYSENRDVNNKFSIQKQSNMKQPNNFPNRSVARLHFGAEKLNIPATTGDGVAKKPFRSKAKRWSRLKVNGYSSDSGKKRKSKETTFCSNLWNEMFVNGKVACGFNPYDEPLIQSKEAVIGGERKTRSRRSRRKQLEAACRYYRRHKSVLSSENDDDDDNVSNQVTDAGNGEKVETNKVLKSQYNTYDEVFFENNKIRLPDSDSSSSSLEDCDNRSYHEFSLDSPVEDLFRQNRVESRPKNFKQLHKKTAVASINKPLNRVPTESIEIVTTVCKTPPMSGNPTAGNLSLTDYVNLQVKEHHQPAKKQDIRLPRPVKHSECFQSKQSEAIRQNSSRGILSPPQTRQPRLGTGRGYIQGGYPYSNSWMVDVSPFRYRRRFQFQSGQNGNSYNRPVCGSISSVMQSGIKRDRKPNKNEDCSDGNSGNCRLNPEVKTTQGILSGGLISLGSTVATNSTGGTPSSNASPLTKHFSIIKQYLRGLKNKNLRHRLRRHYLHHYYYHPHPHQHHHWRDWYSTCGNSSSCSSDDDDQLDLLTSFSLLFSSSSSSSTSSSSSDFDYFLDNQANGFNSASPASFTEIRSATSRQGAPPITCFSSINRFKNSNKNFCMTTERWVDGGVDKGRDKFSYSKQCSLS